MKNATMRVLSLSLVVALGFVYAPVRGDTVILRNGNKIEGQVIDNRDTAGEVIIRFGEMGQMKLRAHEVAGIVKSGDAAPAEKPSTTVLTAAEPPSEDPQAGDLVIVRLPESADTFFAAPGAAVGGQYLGILSADSNEEIAILEIPDAGKIKIPRMEGMTIVKAPAHVTLERPVSDARTIQTTHVVQLKNGRKLQGNVLPTAESEPVKLQVGHLGIMNIRRGTIAEDGIQAVDGVIELPERPAEAEPPVRPVLPDDVREELKAELRSEVLREIIDRKIDEAIDSMFDRPPVRSFGMLLDPGAGLPAETVDEIATQISELTRQRNTNRVRAEASLKRIGSPALPFLERITTHPFNLARRAVQRIVADVGDLRGVPLAIGALNDPDAIVRELAGKNVITFLGDKIAYRPDANEAERVEAQNEFWGVWDALILSMARENILAKIAISE